MQQSEMTSVTHRIDTGLSYRSAIQWPPWLVEYRAA